MSYVLITGANSGIGFALAHEFALHGHSLILVGRNSNKIQIAAERLQKKFPQQHFYKIIQDLTKPNAAQKIYEEVCRQNLFVQILVNNAGIGYAGAFVSASPQIDQEMIATNITALTELCKFFIPMLQTQTHAGILNVASNGAFHPGPYTAAYYATKAYVLHFSKALRFELKKDGICVSTLCPGATISDFCRKAGKKQIKGSMPAEKVARIAYRQFSRKKSVILPGIQNHLAMLAPKSVRSRIVGITQKRLSSS